MGEVYKARDTRVDRSVAIKILPGGTTRTSEAESRFAREARALAALSHPRICALFEFTRIDGEALLIMEYLEGQLLSERLAKGRLPLPDALRIAVEMADGLAAAHRAGLVHRDLKPGNVMLTKEGVKLLDFGLAKVAVRDDLSGGDAATRQDLTRTGIVFGTVPFMAPEQLDGRPVDHRTDIWAFGCVIYEMITGHRAFDGPTAPAIAAAILEREPPTLSKVDPKLPPALERVVRKCLARDPDARWQSAGDLRDEVQWIARGGGDAPLSIASVRTRWRDILLGAVAGALVVAAALLIPRSRPSAPAAAPARQLELTIPRVAAIESLALSPDASNLAFIAAGPDGVQSVWIKSLANAAVRPVVGTEGAVPASPPFWSPGGDSIAFVAGNKLRRVSLASGQVQPIADVRGVIFGGDWGRDGTILLGTYQVSKTRGIHKVAATGGQLEPVTTLEPDVLLHATPKFLPDGRRFLFLEWAFDERKRDVCAASLDSPAARCFGVRSHFFAGATDRHIVYSRDATMFAHPFDVRTATLSGNPTILAERLSEDRLGRIGVSVAGSGTLVYHPAAYKLRQLVRYDRSGARVGVVGDPAVQDGFDADATGNLVAVERLGDDGTQLWVIDVARGTTTRAEVGRDPVWAPVLSQDGQSLTYIARGEGRTAVVERPTHGGTARVVFEYRGEGVVYLADRTPDGRAVLVGVGERNGRTMQLVPTDGGQPRVIREGGVSQTTARVSPDGKWLAFASDQSGRLEVHVSPIPATGQQWQVSASGGEFPQWRGDGRELFFIAPDGSVMSAAISATPGFDFTAPRVLFKTGLRAGEFSQRFVATADGKQFLFNMLREGDSAATTTTLRVFLNWTDGLTQ